MDEDTLHKFVENMRAAGQPDEMIAENLLSAGHAELEVLNAFGVEHLSQLSDSSEDEDGAPNPKPVAPAQQADIPSAYVVVDDKGNPIISQDNLPKAMGAEPAPAPKPVAQPKVPRSAPRGRRYPRPAPRRATPRSRPTQAPKDSGFIYPAPGELARPKVAPKKELTPQTKKPNMKQLLDKEEAEPELKLKSASPQKKYEHHTFDDFMGRIKGHKELPEGDEHTLEAHYADKVHEPEPHFPDEEERHHTEVMKRAAAVSKPEKNMLEDDERDGPGSIDALLDEQKAEAAEGPGGPEIHELIDKKDLEELEKMPDEKTPPKPVDLRKEHQPSDIARAADKANDIRNSIWLKVTIILIGVLALVALAASVMRKVVG